MRVRLDFDELDSIKEMSNKNREDLNYQIDRMLESLERLRTIWRGDASDIFYKNAHPYIERMKVLGEFMDLTSNFVGKYSNSYYEQDQAFSQSIKKEVILADEQNNTNNKFS